MMVNWDAYQPYDPGVDGLLENLPRRDAKRAFDKLMNARQERFNALERLLVNNGALDILDTSDTSIQIVDDWFINNVTGDARTSRLDNTWYSVVNDIALYLGDIAIERNPSIGWVMFTHGKKDMAYQRHVLMGFNVPNRLYNVDIDYAVATYGQRRVSGHVDPPGYFLEVLQSIGADA